jgi:hypothetical protein
MTNLHLVHFSVGYVTFADPVAARARIPLTAWVFVHCLPLLCCTVSVKALGRALRSFSESYRVYYNDRETTVLALMLQKA